MSLRRLIGLIAAVVMLGLPPLALAQVPNPTVSPVNPARSAFGAPTHDYPWMSTLHNLGAVGYVEEEFFYEGEARRFETAAPWVMGGKLIDGGHKYKTRMIVRRPKDMKKFNGTVLAEWQNVTAGFDLDAMWGGSFEHIVRAGYVWVGLSPQRVGVQGEPNGLKLWSPTRYGSLDVTDGGKVMDDALSYDIYAQGLQAIKNPQGVNVLGGAKPKILIAMGASQSAGRLGTYINSLNEKLGGPVDAYLLMIGGARIREDMNKPVFKILSETDVPGQVASRQPDSTKIRRWEVAGASHSSRRTSMNSGPTTKRDNVTRAVAKCTYPTYPRVPMNDVLSAIYDHMATWVATGVAPPTAPLMEVKGNVIERDGRGNGKGGIRLAEFDPPVALNTGANSGDSFCSLYGRFEPFSDDVLKSLYPTHKAYVDKANAVTAANLSAGYILGPDAKSSRSRAAQSIVGAGAPCAAACHAAQDLLDSAYFYLGVSSRRDAMTTRMAGIVGTISKGNGVKAKADLAKLVADLKVMQARGEISETAAAELSSGADAVIKAL